jgi:hypothetical protein
MKPRHLLCCIIFTVLTGAALGNAQSTQPAPQSPLRWWKGNLHTHSLWQGGDDFPECIAQWYKDHGYNFLCLSEHNRLAQGTEWLTENSINSRARANAVSRYLKQFGPDWTETRKDAQTGKLLVRLKTFDEYRPRFEEQGRFMLIQGEEVTDEARDGRPLHMIACNLTEPIKPQSGSNIAETIRRDYDAIEASGRRSGHEVYEHVNHPNYQYGMTAEDLAENTEVSFFEIWNGVDDDNDPGDAEHLNTDGIWDVANTLRIVKHNAPPLLGVGSDDAHNYHGTNNRSVPGRAWLMVRARELTIPAVFAAMRKGDFYASTGVVLDDIAFDAGRHELSIQIHPQPGEQFVTRFIGTRKGANMTGRPRLDKAGKPIHTTLDYSTPAGPQIGEILAEVTGTSAVYRFKGDELYVRAVVTSTAPTEVFSREFKFKRAWTQPVGWTLSTGTRAQATEQIHESK